MRHIAIIAALTLSLPAVATAQEAPAEDGARPIGLNVDLGVQSAYLFRGINVFAESELLEQKAFLAPSLTWTGLDGRLAIGYWGAYQIVGSNIGAKIDAAAGAESDLVVSYSHALAEGLALSAGAVAYLYPMADEAVVGTSMPTVIEPIVGLGFSSVVDLGFKVSYFLPAQSAIQSWRYLYLNPSVGKTLSLTETVGLSASAGFGYKALADFDDNVLDVLVTVAAPVSFGALYVKPAVNLTWTNLESLGFGDEVSAFGGVNVGINL
jgi:hypothetical protein